MRVDVYRVFAAKMKLSNFEKTLAENVRRHRIIYDPNLHDHGDLELTQSAWNDISAATGKNEAVCRKAWKNLRDKFVRIKRKIHTNSKDPGSYRKIVAELGWLCQYVKHREKSLNAKDGCKGVTFEEFMKTDNLQMSSASGTSETGTSDNPSPLSLMPSSPVPSTPVLPTQSTLVPATSSTPPPPCPSSKCYPSPCLVSAFSVPNISPSPNASPSSSELMPKRKSTSEACLLNMLEQMEWTREKTPHQDSEDFRFASVVVDMLAKIDPRMKSEVKFKIYQMLYEAERTNK